MNHKITTIIFDFDGTLADTFELRVKSWKAVLEKHCVDYNKSELNKLLWRGADNEEILTRISLSRLTEYEQATILASKDKWRLKNVKKIKLFPESVDVLRFLHNEGFQLAICSRNLVTIIHLVLRREGIRSLISEIEARATNELIREHSDILGNLISGLGGDPAEVLLVGDTHADQESALKNSVRFIQIKRIHDDSEQQTGGADSIQSLYELLSRTGVPKVNRFDAKTVGSVVLKRREEEYRFLREEILQNQRLRAQVLAFNVVAIAALIGIPLKFGTEPSLRAIQVVCSFAPYVLLIPSCYLVSILSRQVTNSGTFMAVFYEGFENWPGREFAKYWRDKYRSGINQSTRLNYALFFAFLGLLTFIYCLVITQLLVPENSCIDLPGPWGQVLATRYVLISANVLFYVLLLYFAFIHLSLKRSRHLRMKENYLRRWISVHEIFVSSSASPLEHLKRHLYCIRTPSSRSKRKNIREILIDLCRKLKSNKKRASD